MASLIRVTPWVLRPRLEISLTRVRTKTTKKGWDMMGQLTMTAEAAGILNELLKTDVFQPGVRVGTMPPHGDPTGGQRRPAAPAPTRNPSKQRRSNILFVLVVSTACTLFLAATTGSTVMLYGFVLAFLALCGYLYLLAQSNQRNVGPSYDNWLD